MRRNFCHQALLDRGGNGGPGWVLQPYRCPSLTNTVAGCSALLGSTKDCSSPSSAANPPEGRGLPARSSVSNLSPPSHLRHGLSSPRQPGTTSPLRSPGPELNRFSKNHKVEEVQERPCITGASPQIFPWPPPLLYPSSPKALCLEAEDLSTSPR